MKEFITVFLFFACTAGLNAQNVGIGTTSPHANAQLHVDLQSNFNKGILFTGVYNASSVVPDVGAGTRLMFFPGKSAFRVGTVSGNQWDNSNVGHYSIAIGNGTIAIANYSMALGTGTIANKLYSTAIGYNTMADGNFSVALGNNTLTQGASSTAIGSGTVAGGIYSLASGFNTIAKSYASTVVGMYNDSVFTSNQLTVDNTQLLFIVGNGTSNALRSNALIVRKDGKVGVGTSVPHESAIMDIVSSSKGILIPRLTTLQRTSISAPAKGLLVFDTESNSFWFRNDSTWAELTSHLNAVWLKTGNNVYNTPDSIGIGTNAPKAKLHVELGTSTTGGFMVTGEDHSSGAVPDLNAGSRLMYYPGKAAFRAGSVDGAHWDNINVGRYSVATGRNTTASADYSSAGGNVTTASGVASFASGFSTHASGAYSTAMGGQNTASGDYSFAGGSNSRALGAFSLAIGNVVQAAGTGAVAFGGGTVAAAHNSLAAGVFLTAKGYASTVIGMYNDSILVTTQTSSNNSTPLFIIGNGTGFNNRSNAMVVRKDGKIGIGTNAPDSRFHLELDSSLTEGFIISGTASASGTIPDLAQGSRMMFFPGKSAFRAGTVTAAQWNNNNVGRFSFAGGYNTTASGYASTALGNITIASNANSTAMGNSTTASGLTSTALGEGTTASGTASTAIGTETNATSSHTLAAGLGTTASGQYSFSMGYHSIARANGSAALGYTTIAGGRYSFSTGDRNVAKGYASTVVGMFNDSLITSDQTAHTLTTPLFIVGNGNDHTTRSNAMVVRKNGDTEIENINVGGGTVISKLLAGEAIAGSNGTSGFKTYTLVFPTPFATIPKVTAAAKNDPLFSNVDDTFIVSVRNVSATQVVFNIQRVDSNTGWSQQLRVGWMAWE